MFKNSRKIIVLLLSLVLIVSMVGCNKTEDTVGEDGIYKPGTYVGVGKGHNGDVKVEVKFDANKIISVKVLEHEETENIASTPIERIPEEIVKDQTLNMDTVAGATFTSNSILEAVEDAVLQAGGDVEVLKAAIGKEDDEKVEKEMTTDVVVIGAGGTGLAAAASAHENGAEVIVLEKLPMTGGFTAISGGGISATGSKFQEELGIEDSKESWLELWKERQATEAEGKYPDYDKVDKFMDEAIVTTHWLADYIGIEYATVDGFGFDPVRRLHTPENGGSAITTSIEQFIGKEGIEVLTETPATLKSFNEGVKTGKDEFNKQEEMLVSVEEGPFYAFRVLREDGTIINNLYAGGECANKPLYNKVYMSGSSVQFALTSGRIAGEDAANSLDK